MAKTYDLYESPEWRDADPDTRLELEQKESQEHLLNSDRLKDQYLLSDEPQRREMETELTAARHRAFSSYFEEEELDKTPTAEELDARESEPFASDAPTSADDTAYDPTSTTDTRVPLTRQSVSAIEAMKKDQTYYPGGYSQVKTDTKILRKVFM
ncbi:MAG: hypothetical protein ACYS76_16355, partial [Planctomycetota bacterium]